MMNMKSIAYAAKERLLDKIDAEIDRFEMSGKVSDQMNATAARQSREVIESLNRVEAYKLEKAVAEKEYYDPAKDKFGFGPTTVKPTDYPYFLEKI